MASFNDVLVTLLLVLGVVLIVFSIIISIKLIYTVDKLNISSYRYREEIKKC